MTLSKNMPAVSPLSLDSDNLFISGSPAKIHKDRIKEDIALRNLPQFFKKIKNKV